MPEPQTEKTFGRTSTLMSATLCWQGGEAASFVRNISEMGALLECEAKLQPEALIVLRRGELEVNGSIVWAKDNTYGVRFRSMVDPAVWIGETTPKKSSTLAYASSLKQHLEEGEDVSSLICNRVSEEIAYTARLLESSCISFSKDAVVCNRYPTQIQNISIAIQMLTELHSVLNATDKISEIESKVTGPMKARMLR